MTEKEQIVELYHMVKSMLEAQKDYCDNNHFKKTYGRLYDTVEKRLKELDPNPTPLAWKS